MYWQATPYVIPIFISLVLSIAIILFNYPRRFVRGAKQLIYLNAVMAVWTIGYIFELYSPTLAGKIFWDNVQMLLSVLVLFFFIFVRTFTRHETEIKTRVLFILAVIPLLTIILAWTDNNHGLVRTDIAMDTSGPIPALVYGFGSWYWVDVAFSSLLYLISILLLVNKLMRASQLERVQITIILIGAVVPAVGFTLGVAGLTPKFVRDPAPFVFTIQNVLLAIAIFYYRLFEVVPEAREYLVDNMPDGMIVLDNDMQIVDINPAGRTILDVSLKKTLNQTLDSLKIIDNHIIRQMVEEIVLKPDKNASREIILSSGGVQRYYNLHLSCVCPRDADAGGWMVLLQDITRFKELETALRTSESKYRSVSERANDGIAIIQDGLIRYSNPRWMDLTGYHDSEELPVSELLASDEMSQMLEYYDQLSADDTHLMRFEANLVHKEGYDFLVEVNASMMDYESRPAVLVFARDITERKRAELAEREGREMAEALRASAEALGSTLDFDQVLDRMLELIERVVPFDFGNIMLIEEGVASMVRTRGYEKCCPYISDELLTNTDFDVKETANIRWMVENKKPLLIDDVNEYPGWVRKTKIPQTCGWVGAPIIAHGEAIGFISLDKIEASYFNEKHAERLAIFAGHASLALENSRLFAEAARARDEAEEAARVKSVFLANMSHEIRTPLNAVIGMTGLLLDVVSDDESFEYVQTIRTSSEALLAIINDILDFTKIEAGKLDLDMQPFELSECIEEAIDLVSTTAAEKELELVYLIDENVAEIIHTDEVRLRQVLINLLGNAVKFTNQGEVVVQVENYPDEDSADGIMLHFSVRDTGIGIPNCEMGNLFQVFHQVDTSMTRKYGGTGLGLTISKELCNLMGGDIWVESEGIPGKGSIFHFTIKAEVVEQNQNQYRQARRAELVDKKVLLVDDHAVSREYLSRNIGWWGLQVQVAASAAEALQMLQNGEHYDAIYIDRGLPGMDGVELALEIRKFLPENDLPMVLMTILGQAQTQSYPKIFSAYLSKPVKKTLLYTTLLKVIAGEDSAVVKKLSGFAEIESSTAAKKPLRILVAEDNPVNQRVVLKILERLGYRADVAANGLDVLIALKKLKRKNMPIYDVILMDIQMPEMDGVETARRIRADLPDVEQPYIVALTANAMQGDRDRYLAAGMDDYLSKPLRIHQLQRILWNIQATEEEKQEQETQPAVIALPAPVPDVAENNAAQAAKKTVQTAIDHNYMNTYWDGLQDDANSILAEMFPVYLEESEKQLELLRQALERKETDLLWKTAHSLKGASFPFGALVLAEHCRQLEMAGKENRLDEAAYLYQKIESELQKLKEELHVLLGSQGASW